MLNFLKELVFRIRGKYTVERLKKMGLRVGKNFNPQLGFELDPSHCWLIEIGNNVTFGPNVQILAHDASMHNIIGYTRIGNVSIGDNVFIGAGSIVLPNVKIGDNSIIGAGSVVTKDIPKNTVYAGNPVKMISTIDEFTQKHKQLMQKCPIYQEEYTLRGNIDKQKKEKQCNDLKDTVGYIV